MVRTVTPFLFSSLVLGSIVGLTEFSMRPQANLPAGAEQLHAQADRGDDGSPYRGSSGRRVLRQTQTLDS
ncbi:MAG TPA: hypothetical protein IGS17_17350 [Oscillatoriales cyanobacterium M59_W2019_021]|nr:MAG: hypothetical protein D6728_08040 [Cyanobacteria bacterium J055]HIK33670.1 hypothetical protein [Oscillatoriales cyanobacterium M4454_W2019_049]HIK52672.1 hypothetical protein [Oscillatoriales cyanobacterium M59_W2019_021]